MASADLHNTMKYSRGISPVAAVTNDDAFVSQIVDTANAEATEFVIQLGAIADADATFTILVEDGDVSTLTDNAAVADSELLGTEAGAAFLFSDDNKTVKIGYIGHKRYVRVTITPANNTGNIFLSAMWVQRMRKEPQSSQIV